MHLFSGPVDVEAYVGETMAAKTLQRTSMSDLEERVAKLEAEVAELKVLLNS
jgi:uncharacterized protein YceH (UPF0502 family)